MKKYDPEACTLLALGMLQCAVTERGSAREWCEMGERAIAMREDYIECRRSIQGSI